MTDIQIAQQAVPLPIGDIAASLSLIHISEPTRP